jgi:predicted alpha/beta-hydrolase family hydrolase
MDGQSGQEWSVDVGRDRTTALFEPAVEDPQGTVFVFAHGAGGHRADRGMTSLAEVFHGRAIGTVRFNFVYRERGSGRLDRMPQLEECVAAVAARARAEVSPRRLIIGGRSMGGRAASMLAARGFDCSGLLLLAYPLHPAGHPERLRDAHLSRIGVPVLCVNGTRDALCRRELMEQTQRGLSSNWTMYWLEGADHSFHVTKTSGRTDAGVLSEIGDAAERWAAALAERR